MATDIDPKTAAALQATMANVEAAFRQTNLQRTALSALINAGRATCRDVQTYNLQVKAVYAYQASVAGIVKAQGGNAPSVPAPIYVVWRGIQGDQAANIDCNAAQMRGAAGNGLGDFFLNPNQIEWRQEAMPSDVQVVRQVTQMALQGGPAPAGQLGIAPLIVVAIIIVGIIVTITAYIALKIVEALTDVPGKQETTKQIAVQAEQHRLTLEQRAACYQDCANRGKDPVECAKACDRLTPGFVAQYPGGGWGIVGTVAGIGVVGLLVYAGVRFARSGGFDHLRRYAGGHQHGRGQHMARHQLPAGRDHDDDDDDVIDAEYEEVG